jgi:endonuclease G
LAFVAGVNYDPNAPYQQARSQGREEWRYDQRVAPVRQLQVGESLFGGNPLDKGHLVRRADAAWGQTMEEARLAGDDTFHYTNCSPQHEITNRGLVQQAPPGLVLWGRLEDFLADEGKKFKRKLCIFNGPIFRPSDRRYRDVQLPKEFWKIVAFLGSSGEPRAVGFRLTQEPLIQGLEENLPLQAFETVQVSIESLERATLLDMAPLVRLDVLRKRSSNEHLEGLSEAIRIRELGDIIQ